MTPLTSQQADALLRANPRGVVYLIGIGGCGVSGLAHLLLDFGHRVVGSDLVSNEETRQLSARGAQIHTGHSADHVKSAGPALVIYSSAIRSDNPELQEAQRLGIPVVCRAVALSALVHRQAAVCVAGMHGKTTTASLLAYALENLRADPSYAVGALVPQLTRHARCSANGSSKGFFVIEADESDGTLREFHPEAAIILNVDEEHLDYFPNLDAVCAEFRQFASQTRGPILFCADDLHLAEMLAHNPNAISYGFHPLARYRIILKQAGSGLRGSLFEVWQSGTCLGEFRTQLLGDKNVSNATAVIALLHKLGFAPAEIGKAISGFTGAARRQQVLFADSRCQVIEDYGHHPAEIEATLSALKAFAPGRLLVAFQPHRYTRTQHLLPQFATCFKQADRLWITEIYAASEPPIAGVTGERFAAAIRDQGQTVEFVPSLEALPQAISRELRSGDIVLFLGAGDITRAAQQFAAELKHLHVGDKQELAAELTTRVSRDTAVRANEPLAKRTTLRVGGPADIFLEPSSEADLAATLKWCREKNLPFTLLGRGSNLLVRDGGIRGVVICLMHANFSRLEVKGDRLHCGAGVKLKNISVEARRHGLTGMEFVEGIPGTLGGSMRMNAGAMGSWLFDVIESIRFMDYEGNIHERKAGEVYVEYRGCPLFKNHIALGAVLKGQHAPAQAIADRMTQFSHKRWDSQPAAPSAGCIFKNPPTIPAGKLVDELGLKGTRVGGAAVSDVHGNFIVNTGNATARDVLNLIEVIRGRARSARGIELDTEVEILGEDLHA
jgi:UDP-N-acetylmuramate--L-alanine ligase/UDP-N-acetylenolpyruvoylglucosamine reductase